MLDAHGDFQLDRWSASHPTNALANPEQALERCPERPFRAWYCANFGGHVRVDLVVYFGIFAVHRDHVRHRNGAGYRRLLRYVDGHSNPEAGHYLERAWLAVFYPVPYDCCHAVS